MRILMHAGNLESIRPLSNNERYGAWAAHYFSEGHHHYEGRVVDREEEARIKKLCHDAHNESMTEYLSRCAEGMQNAYIVEQDQSHDEGK